MNEVHQPSGISGAMQITLSPVCRLRFDSMRVAEDGQVLADFKACQKSSKSPPGLPNPRRARYRV